MAASESDLIFLKQAVKLAQAAESQGNLPIGSLLVLDQQVIAEGQNAVLKPYNPGGHAEIEAIRAVPLSLWPRAAEMTCYSTLEPCLMCFGTLLLHGVGRVVFGALDDLGGARHILEHLPPYYDQKKIPLWEGPYLEDICRPFYLKAHAVFSELPCGGQTTSIPG